MKDVISFLKKNDYVVTATQQEKGLEVKFPPIKNRFTTRAEKKIAYTVKYGKKSSLTIAVDDKEPEVVFLPAYCIRLYVCADIIRECLVTNYAAELVEAINKKKESVSFGISDELISFMKEPKVDDFEKETKLRSIFSQCLESGFLDIYEEYSTESEVIEGYVLIKNLIESGLF